MACAGLLALAGSTVAPGLAMAQRTISLGGSGPADAPAPLDVTKSKIPAINPATVQGLPAARDYLPPEGVRFKAADVISENVRLTAQWFWTAENDGRKLPTVLIAPGWGAVAATARQDAVDLARAGYLVMLFDYRGWGDSDGRLMAKGQRPAAGAALPVETEELRGYIDPWEQAQDWFNAVSYAVTDPMVDAGRIGLFGSDLAGGYALYVAAHDPRIKALASLATRADTRPSKPYQRDPDRLLAEADIAASRLATGAQPGRLPGVPVGHKVARWDAPVHEADDVTAPALFVLTEKEELFSNRANGQLACERVQGSRKMVILPKVTHYDIYGAERERAVTIAIDWFDRYLKPPGAPTRVPIDRRQPERGECNPPPLPPAGEEKKEGSGEGHKAQSTSGRFN